MIGCRRWLLSAHSGYIWVSGAIRNNESHLRAFVRDETNPGLDHLPAGLISMLSLFRQARDSL